MVCVRSDLLNDYVPQAPSPAGQLVSPVPLEQTPAEEESRKSISRSFKGTMASSSERKLKSHIIRAVVECRHANNTFLFLSSM